MYIEYEFSKRRCSSFPYNLLLPNGAAQGSRVKDSLSVPVPGGQSSAPPHEHLAQGLDRGFYKGCYKGFYRGFLQ